MKKVVIPIVIVVAVVLVVGFVPLKEVAYTVMVDCQDTEPLSYEVISAGSGTRYLWGYPPGGGSPGITGLQSVYQVVLKNTDDTPGTFTVQLTFEKTLEKRSQSIYLQPGEEGATLFESSPNSWMGKFTREVIPGTKTVAKQCPETRYKKITLLDYWLHY